MKKIIVISLSVFVFLLAALALTNYLYPYCVHWNAIKYAHELKESKVSKDNVTLCSKITEDETVNSMYITFYILDKNSEKILFECPEGWRLMDFKYLGFEKDSNNILVISGDTGTYRYVNDSGSWKGETVSGNQQITPDSKYYVINNLNDIAT